MSNDTLLGAILSAYANIDHSKANISYPPQFKQLVARYARSCREEGWTWDAIAAQLPVSSTSISKWMRQATTEEGSLVPVTVVPDSKPFVREDSMCEPLTLTSPGGFCLTGMTLDQAALLIGHLG